MIQRVSILVEIEVVKQMTKTQITPKVMRTKRRDTSKAAKKLRLRTKKRDMMKILRENDQTQLSLTIL